MFEYLDHPEVVHVEDIYETKPEFLTLKICGYSKIDNPLWFNSLPKNPNDSMTDIASNCAEF